MIINSSVQLRNVKTFGKRDCGYWLSTWYLGARRQLSWRFLEKCFRAATVVLVVSSVNVLNASIDLLGADTTLTESDFPAANNVTSNSGTPNLTINLTTSDETIASIAAPVANVTLTGSRTLTFSGISTYTGLTTIGSGATLSISSVNNLPSSTTVIMGNNASITVTAGGFSLPPLVL